MRQKKFQWHQKGKAVFHIFDLFLKWFRFSRWELKVASNLKQSVTYLFLKLMWIHNQDFMHLKMCILFSHVEANGTGTWFGRLQSKRKTGMKSVPDSSLTVCSPKGNHFKLSLVYKCVELLVDLPF